MIAPIVVKIFGGYSIIKAQAIPVAIKGTARSTDLVIIGERKRLQQFKPNPPQIPLRTPCIRIIKTKKSDARNPKQPKAAFEEKIYA